MMRGRQSERIERSMDRGKAERSDPHGTMRFLWNSGARYGQRNVSVSDKRFLLNRSFKLSTGIDKAALARAILRSCRLSRSSPVRYGKHSKRLQARGVVVAPGYRVRSSRLFPK